MKRNWFWIAAALLAFAQPAFGETVHLTSGESIKGRIIRVDEGTISIESDKGFGVIEIDRADITLVEFEEAARDPSRTMGFGYFHRVNPNTSGGRAVEFAVDSFSLKFWLSETISLDYLLGFTSTSEGGSKLFEIFSFDVRWASGFRRQANLDLYWGAGAGYLSVTDKTDAAHPIDDTGTAIRLFLGGEIFPVTLPNLGISAELGIGRQSIGNRDTTNLSTTTFPSFSMRYYF